MSNAQEISLVRQPIVQDSLQHNVRVLSTIRQPIALLLGLIAGALSLTSFLGFAFYFAGSLTTSLFIYLILLKGDARRYFYVAPSTRTIGKGKSQEVVVTADTGFSVSLLLNMLFGGGVLGVEGIMGFIMAWTLGFNYIGRGA